MGLAARVLRSQQVAGPANRSRHRYVLVPVVAALSRRRPSATGQELTQMFFHVGMPIVLSMLMPSMADPWACATPP